MQQSPATLVQGATVVFEDRVEPADVRFEGGVITAIDGARDGARVIDGSGLLLAPALVDVHGDAFERQLMPRPGVMFPLPAAVLETDRQLAANGVGTAYHALTLGWEPGLRSVETARALFDGLKALAPRLTVENRLQLRWETFCFEAIDFMAEVLKGPVLPSIAFNDHTSMAMLDESVTMQERPADFDPSYPVVDTSTQEFARAMTDRAKRSHLTVTEMVALLDKMWARRPDVPAAIAKVAALGREAGAPMFSHDDSQKVQRDHYRDLGARVSEFPMNVRTAQAARDAGDLIVFGAPNAARGGSHLGSSPNAADMIRRGLCDVLASDYYYPAMLLAVARLGADGVAPLHELWRLISTNAAEASGLNDRGAIAIGLRADLVLVNWPGGETPVVERTWVAGREAYSATAAQYGIRALA